MLKEITSQSLGKNHSFYKTFLFSQAGWVGVLRRSFPGVLIKFCDAFMLCCYLAVLWPSAFILLCFLAYQHYVCTLQKHKGTYCFSFMKRAYFLFWLCLFLSPEFFYSLACLFFMYFLLKRGGEGMLSQHSLLLHLSLVCHFFFMFMSSYLLTIYVFVKSLMFYQSLRQLLRILIIKQKNKHQTHRKYILEQ